MVVDEDPETIEGWTAILNGLTQVRVVVWRGGWEIGNP